MTTKPTPAQLKRAKWERLVARLPVPQNTSIKTAQRAKQKPACGVMASV